MKAIITYHSIDDCGSVISVDPSTFRRHMDWLVQASVPVLSVDAVLEPECDEGVALTFDDGFQNFADLAWPILRDHGFPATVFIATDWVGRTNAWDASDERIPDLPLMDWPTLSRLVEEGAELGSHTRTHPNLTTLRSEALAEEVVGSRADLEAETGVTPTSFAYPYGHYDQAALAALDAAGYASAHTTRFSLLSDHETSPMELPRLDAYYLRAPGTLERWGTERFRRWTRFRAGARRVRASLVKAGLLS